MAVIIDIDHENNDLSEYTATVTDGGDMSVTAAAALVGTSYGLQAVINDTNSMYGQVSITNSNIIRTRFYLDLNTLAMTDKTFGILSCLRGDATVVFYLCVNENSGTFYLGSVLYNDAGGASTVYGAVSSGVHYVEIKLTRATDDVSANGRVDWWIDNVAQTTIINVDNYHRWNGDLVDMRIGVGTPPATLFSGISGTIYLDQWVANDDGGLIGPFVGAPIAQTNNGSLSFSGASNNRTGKITAGALILSKATSLATGKVLSGALPISGTLNKAFTRALSGVLSLSGTVGRTFVKAFSGVLSLAGSISGTAISKLLSGSLTIAGGLTKSTTRVLSGAVDLAGTFTYIITKLITLNGSLSLSGLLQNSVVNKVAGAVLSMSGTLQRATSKTLTGILAPVATLTPSILYDEIIAGVLSFSGAITKRTSKLLSGSITPTGVIGKLVGKIVAGAVSFSTEVSLYLLGVGSLKPMFRKMWENIHRRFM
jgi:hypothetical protein